MRKILTGLISIAVVVSAFTIYSRLNRTPDFNKGRNGEIADSSFHINSDETIDENQIGMVGDFGVGPVQDMQYIQYNENGEIQSELGFDLVLHKQGSVWEVDQPYYNLYMPDFSCYMTADKGIVEVITASGTTTVNDLTFSGNVVIRILPVVSGTIQESYIFLDDIMYLSSQSKISTAGPVKFISQDVEMLGKGLEIIYDSGENSLEYCRILHLESLKVTVANQIISSNDQSQAQQQSSRQSEPDNNAESAQLKQQQYYRCLFSKNVMIDTQEQMIFTGKKFSIDNILLKQAAGTEEDAEVSAVIADTNDPEPITAGQNDPNQASEKKVEIIITCDDGITITGQDNLQQDVASTTETNFVDISPEISESAAGKMQLLTHILTYDMLTGDALAVEPAKVIFDIGDLNDTDSNQKKLPLTITAEKSVKFIKLSNQVLFEGNCLCTIPQQGLSELKNATLSSTLLTLDIPQTDANQTPVMPNVTAAGPAELLFYIEDVNDETQSSKFIPVNITAQNQIRFLSESSEVIFEGDSLCIMGSESLDKEHLFSLKSPKLTVNLPMQNSEETYTPNDILADGPVELNFYVDDISSEAPPREYLPAVIRAQKQALFSAASNSIIFEGPCISTITRQGTDFVEIFKLSSQTMTVDIPEDMDNQADASPIKLKHLVAEGGQVILSAEKYALNPDINQGNEKLLMGVKIQCTQIDCNPEDSLFTAKGPGEIIFNESKLNKSGENDDESEVQWWAQVEEFEILQYIPKENRIIAAAPEGRTLAINYTTIVDGEIGPVIKATAGNTEIELATNSTGQMELSNLIASSGIYYQDDDNVFIGSRLIYDPANSIMTVEGDSSQPCLYNGLPVETIEYDLASKKVDIQGISTGMMPIRQ